jgi:hypothetical protein
MRPSVVILGILGAWVAMAPEAMGWRALADSIGEGRLVRFLVGFSILLGAGLVWEKNRMRRHIQELLDVLNRLVYGKDYAKHREAVDLLLKAAATAKPEVAGKAFDSLRQVTGRDFGDDPALWEAWWRENKRTFSIAKTRKGGPQSGDRGNGSGG